MNKKNHILTKLFLISIIISCSPDYNLKIGKTEKKFYQGRFLEASRDFIPLVNQKGKDQFLFMLEASLMLHTAKEYRKSNMVFMKASKIAAQISTSISKQIKSLLLNERSTNYKGEDFERVLIHTYSGINYLFLKMWDDARIEFKKVNNQLKIIHSKRGKKYKQNIMAKYLTAIAYEISADLENDDNDREFAYIEYKQIHKLRPNLFIVYKDLLRLSQKLGYMDDFKNWQEKFSINEDYKESKGELIIIFQSGRGPIKVSRGKLMSDKVMAGTINLTVKKMTFSQGLTAAAVLVAMNNAENPIPAFKKRSNRIKKLKILANGTPIGTTILLEDINRTAIRNLQDNYRKIRNKIARGLVAKVAASLLAGSIARAAAKQAKKIKKLGAFGQVLGASADIIGSLASAGTAAALFSQLKPDLRCWHTLPAKLHIGRFPLKPGTYELEIQFIGNDGNILKRSRDNITIQKNRKSFLNYRSLK